MKRQASHDRGPRFSSPKHLLVCLASVIALQAAAAAAGACEGVANAAPGLEPSTMLIVGAALAGAAWCGRRLPGIGRKEPPKGE